MDTEVLYMVMPAYNEEENIEETARSWHEVLTRAGENSRLVIINDGSKDHTYDILCRLQKELPQLVPLTKPNSGHGATLLYGYHYALDHGADYIFQTDSDGQTRPEEFPAFWNRRHERDVIIGYRNHREDGASRVLVTKVLKFVLWMIFHLQITDANTPFRLMKRDTLQKYIQKVPKDFNLSNVMLTVLFVKNKVNMEFVPITFRPRQGGVNSINFRKIIGIGRQAVRDFRTIRKTI